MRGRPRKPRAVHERQGTARARTTPAGEPSYPRRAPAKPPHIRSRAIASRVWDHVVPLMMAEGTLTPAYSGALEMFCLSYADVLELEARASKGFAIRRKLLRSINDAKKEYRQWTTQLGLSPATVGKVTAAAADDDDTTPLEKIRRRRLELVKSS